ncbi:beta-ketoacyl synthase N-terminal-like domain-containing protein [Streptomyces triculaminicus]|uniref:beta-ketoacyl synthase N-terminal-like domain-containing protein n=1 Tax=Streptomyces triculaminicus TaxID=2816232 RepID=UPI0033CB6A7D
MGADDHTTNGEQAVAIIGAGLRLPGGITGLDGLWRTLIDGRNTDATPACLARLIHERLALPAVPPG